MCEPIEEWLERINEKFSKSNIPHRQRPWVAWQEWARHTGLSFSLNDDAVKKIFAWFEKNTKAGSQYMGPLYTGTFLYDACFWPVFIPVVFGTVTFNADDSLKTMPEATKGHLCRDQEEAMQYSSLWADCADYGFGINAVIKCSNASAFAQELYKSGDQQLNATITLLLAERPNPRAVESARMATEMFMKAFLASKSALTEKDAMKISHNMGEALNKCLVVEPHSELQAIRPELSCFPKVGDRYKGTEKTPMELWRAYRVAQFTGATVVRMATGDDIRKMAVVG